jgi:hypothetical protein
LDLLALTFLIHFTGAKPVHLLLPVSCDPGQHASPARRGVAPGIRLLRMFLLVALEYLELSPTIRWKDCSPTPVTGTSRSCWWRAWAC